MKKYIVSTILLGMLSTPSFANDLTDSLDKIPWYRLTQVAVVTAHGMDLATTENCLGAGRCHELNPWLARYDNPVLFGAAKMGVASGSLLLSTRFHDEHPKLAGVMNLAIAGVFVGISLHNYNVSK